MQLRVDPVSNILVISPANDPFTDDSLLIEPIDVLTVATFIKNLGYLVKFVDMDKEKLQPSQINKILELFQPKLVVIPFDYHIPLYTGASEKGVIELVKYITQKNIPVILGGRPPNAYPASYLCSRKIVIVKGEMENSVQALLLNMDWSESKLMHIPGVIFLNNNNEIISTEQNKRSISMPSLPIPDRSFANLSQYIDVRSMLSSRGCVEKCTFCPVHTFWGTWRSRTPIQVVDEIEYLVKFCEGQKILFLDDHATVSKKRMQEISHLIMSREISTTLGCLATVSSFDQETIDLMWQAGFRWIHFGAEFASQTVLDKYNKRITVKQISEAVKGTINAGIRVRTSWILDSPDATLSDLDRTMEMILELNPHEIRAHYLALRAGAPLALEYENGKHTQYIHSNQPIIKKPGVAHEIVLERTASLIKELSNRSYHIIRDSADWGKYSSEELSDPEFRFLSLCPGRYGIGWRV